VPGTLSAVVVSYNRAGIIGTCLRALGFADEVIVVDKSSTDATPEIAAHHADRVVTVPWSPTVEDTRAFAVAQCHGEWILCLDDDECLDPEAGAAIRAELATPRADVYYLPLRHYILGVHDEAAYYWPEHHPRLFRRGAVGFAGTVHGGLQVSSAACVHLPPESGIVIHHLSHRDVAEWIDKCNRYTSRADRARTEQVGADVAIFAHERLDHWLERSHDARAGSYAATVAVLRAVYDIVDRLKIWEEECAPAGAAAFERVCAMLDAGYAATCNPRRHHAETVRAAGPAPGSAEAEATAARAALQARLATLRAGADRRAADAARWAAEAARLRAALTDTELRRLAAEVELASLAAVRERLRSIETSTFWRATGWARRLVAWGRMVARPQGRLRGLDRVDPA
jgi:hypothetical protein